MTTVHSHPLKINRWTNLNSAHPNSTSTVYGKMREERKGRVGGREEERGRIGGRRGEGEEEGESKERGRRR